MSRIGKKPISIPDGVEVKINGSIVVVKGPKGELQKEIRPEVKIGIKDKELTVAVYKNTKEIKAFWGTTRALIFNMIKGVTQGYEKKLQIDGIGYKAKVEGEKLVLQIGFSHPVEIEQPKNIKFSVNKNIVVISGIDKELVGQISAKIRAIRPAEPYKGKGIKYIDEVIRRKAGKKVVAAAV